MSMTAGEKIRILMKRKDVSMGDMAEQTGQSRQNLSNKMNRNNFSEKEIMAMAAVLGYTVEINFIDKDGNVTL